MRLATSKDKGGEGLIPAGGGGSAVRWKEPGSVGLREGCIVVFVLYMFVVVLFCFLGLAVRLRLLLEAMLIVDMVTGHLLIEIQMRGVATVFGGRIVRVVSWGIGCELHKSHK